MAQDAVVSAVRVSRPGVKECKELATTATSENNSLAIRLLVMITVLKRMSVPCGCCSGRLEAGLYIQVT